MKRTILILIAGLAFVSPCFGVANGNLVLHYTMDDNASNTIVSDSKKFSNGTARRNTAPLHIDGQIGGALNLNPCPNTFTVSGTLEPNAAGIYTLAGTEQYCALYRMPNISNPNLPWEIWSSGARWYMGDRTNITHQQWISSGSAVTGTYSPIPYYNQLTVSGTLEPNGAGVYTVAGTRNSWPYYTMPDINYGGNYELWWGGNEAWIMGNMRDNFSGWRRRDASPVGEYTPVVAKGTPIVSGTPAASGSAAVSGDVIISGDYISTNLTLNKMKIFRNSFTISEWIKSKYVGGSCFSGSLNNNIGSSIDLRPLFMMMGYFWNGVPYSWHHNIYPIPDEDSYKNQWTMITCTVEQITPAKVRIRQYLNDKLYKEDVNDFILARWAVQDKNGAAIKDANSVCPPYIGAYNLSGLPIEYAGYGVDFAFDDVKVFNKALTESQVQKLYQEAFSQRKKPQGKMVSWNK